MKKKILIGFITLLVITSVAFLAKSQTNATIDFLTINQFDLNRTGTSLSTNTILLSESDFLQKFGTAVTSTTEYSEENELNMTHYSYTGADVWYANDELQAINITSSNFAFQMSNGTVIKVGDNIASVSNIFPSSWSNKQFTNQVFVGLRDQIGVVDSNLVFQFDTNTNLITEITVQ
jgi:hypothetical protein